MNVKKLQALLKGRRKAPDWSPELETLAELALTLAASLDAGGVGTAAVAKEYRATLVLLSTKENGVNDAFDQLAARLSAKVEYR